MSDLKIDGMTSPADAHPIATEGGERFTLVFDGDLGEQPGSFFLVETPFGKPVAAGFGNAFTQMEELHDRLEALPDNTITASPASGVTNQSPKPEILIGWLQSAPHSDVVSSRVRLTNADKAAGWIEIPVYDAFFLQVALTRRDEVIASLTAERDEARNERRKLERDYQQVMDRAETAEALVDGLTKALVPDPEEPEVIQPLSWLRSMIDECKERGPSAGNDDPDAFHMMVREVEGLYSRLHTALAAQETGDSQYVRVPLTADYGLIERMHDTRD